MNYEFDKIWRIFWHAVFPASRSIRFLVEIKRNKPSIWLYEEHPSDREKHAFLYFTPLHFAIAARCLCPIPIYALSAVVDSTVSCLLQIEPHLQEARKMKVLCSVLH